MDYLSAGLSKIQQASRLRLLATTVRYTKELGQVLACLESAGYIRGYSKPRQPNRNSKVYLKYTGGLPVISGLTRISKRSKRVYITRKFESNKYLRPGRYVISTSVNGCVVIDLACPRSFGGEVLCKIS